MSSSTCVVVTGGAGFLGSHLCDALLARQYKVIAIDNLSMGSMKNIQHNFDDPCFEFLRQDVRDLPALRQACKQADAIVHLAAYKIPRYGNRIETLLVNSDSGRAVLEIAKEKGIKVVMASTSDVYGKNPSVPFAETSDSVIGSSTVARWSYAVSKLFDEHMSFAYQEAYGFPVSLLRFFGAYGPRHHLSWWGGPQSVFISTILNNETVEIHGTGQQTRTFTFVSDTIAGIVAALESDRANGQVINLGSCDEISILELAYLIKELCSTTQDLKLKFVAYASLGSGNYEDVMRRVPDTSKARQLLGFEAQVPLRTGLVRTIEWQRHILGK